MKTPSYPVVPIERIWQQGDRVESIAVRFGTGTWRIPDLREAVKYQPAFELPLCCIDLGSYDFDGDGGLIGFARHMKHVMDSDPDDPVIMDEWGRVIDGRHRITKALYEGRATVPCRRLPPDSVPTTTI